MMDVLARTGARLLLLLAMLVPLGANAQPVAVRDLAVLVDANGTETISSVSSADAQHRFVPLAGVFNAGYTRKVHWLRFTLPAAASPWWLEVAPAYLDDLQLFEPTAAGFSQQRSGDWLPFNSRPEKSRNFIFKLTPSDSANATYFLRLQTTSNSMATLQLWQPEDFNAAKTTDYLKIGVLYGFMLLTLVTNIILWLVLRKPVFGWFGLFIFANLASNFAKDGLMSQYVLPNAPRTADYLVGCTMFFFLSASAPFFRHALQITRAHKFLFALYRLQVVAPLVMMVFVFTDYFTEARQITLTLSFLVGLVVLIRSFRNWHSDETEGRYISLGMALFLLGGMNAVLIVLGWVPGGLSGGTLQQAAYVAVILIFQIALTLRLRRFSDLQLQLEQQNARLREEHVLIEEQARAELKNALSKKIALLETLEQQQAELQKSEFLWRRAIEGTGDGVWDYNVQTGEVQFSDRWAEMLGYAKHEVSGRFESWGNLLHPDDRQRVLKADQASRDGQTPAFRAEFRMQCKDGSYRWILSRGTVVSRDSNGKALRMIGTHTDLTALRQAQAKIERLSYYDGLTNLPNTYLFEST
ncbi:MAG: 7TM-DISM domain-containing protein, partial [Comamonadaceae bacterium]